MTCADVGAWLSLVERQVWDLNVASSNLAAPTIFFHPHALTARVERGGEAAIHSGMAGAMPEHLPPGGRPEG